jgi:hypothetical protein
MKVPTRTGRSWVPATVQTMLRNPVYIGKIVWGRRKQVKRMKDGKITKERPRSSDYTLADGLHPALIDESTFNAAQEYLSENPPRPIGEQHKVANPLSGLVVCGICGRKMIRRPYTNRDQEPTLMCAATSCPNISCKLSAAENAILKACAQWLNEYTVNWDKREKPADDTALAYKQNIMKRAQQELLNLKKQLDVVYDLLEKGIYSTDEFLTRSKALSERITEAQEAYDEASRGFIIEQQRFHDQRLIVPKMRHLLKVYGTMSDAKAKNDLLKEVLEKVVYRKEKKTLKKDQIDEIDLVIYPRIPKA